MIVRYVDSPPVGTGVGWGGGAMLDEGLVVVNGTLSGTETEGEA
jgi:hypothetical protein